VATELAVPPTDSVVGAVDVVGFGIPTTTTTTITTAVAES